MTRMKQATAFMLLLTLIFSSFTFLQASSAQLPKPSTPEFTVEQVEVVPGGEENVSIIVKIRNQPFTPYEVNGTQINLYYQVRTKLHNAGEEAWYSQFGGFDSMVGTAREYPVQSDNEYTSLPLDLYSTNPQSYVNDGKWDIQVQALIGNISLVESTFFGGTALWEFDGERSDWGSSFLDVNQPNGNQNLVIGVAMAVLIAVGILVGVVYLRRRSSR